MAKTWKEKLESDKPRKIVDMPAHLKAKWGPGKLLIPTPLDVDAVIRNIPNGRVMTATELRDELARQFGADKTCAMCFGMFWRIAAEAAEEAPEAQGGTCKTPYWRVVADDGKLNPKLPGGIAAHAEALRQEGHSLAARKIKLH